MNVKKKTKEIQSVNGGILYVSLSICFFQTQFVAVVIHTGINMFHGDCNFPQGFNVAVFLYAISLIMLFANFFVKSYTNKQKTKQQKDAM